MAIVATMVMAPAPACGGERASRDARVAGDTLTVVGPDSLGSLPFAAQYAGAAAYASREWTRRDRPAGIGTMLVRIDAPAGSGPGTLRGHSEFRFTRDQLEGRAPMVRTGRIEVESTRTRLR